MRLHPEKIEETSNWSNKDFNLKSMLLTVNSDALPSEIRIYFADKTLILEKKLFSGLPYLTYKQNPNAPAGTFKLMPGLALDRRYAFCYAQVDGPAAIEHVDLE